MEEPAEYHYAAFPKALAHKLVERGYETGEIFRGTTFDEDLLKLDAPRCPISNSINFFEHAAKLTGNENLGFQMSKSEDIRGIGLLCYVGLAAPTVGGFLENFARYSQMLTKAVDHDISRLYSDGAIDWKFVVPAGLMKRQYGEYSLTCMVNTIHRYCTKDFTLKLVRFQHSRRHNTEEIEAYFGCKVEFDAECYGYDFELEDLNLPLISADPKLLTMLQSCSDEALSEKDSQMPNLLVDVERVIADQLSSGLVTIETVATDLGISPAKLTRDLHAENTSLVQLKEDLRQSLAKRYLRNSDLMPTEVAFLLGYSKFSRFNNDFKRWTGRSPGSFALHAADKLVSLD